MPDIKDMFENSKNNKNVRRSEDNITPSEELGDNISSDMEKSIYDIEFNDKEIEGALNNLDDVVSKRMRSLDTDVNGSIATLLQNNSKDFPEEDRRAIEEFNKVLTDGGNAEMLSQLFANEYSNTQYFINFETLKTFIPDLSAAHEDMKNSILYPESYMSEFNDYVKHDKATSDTRISDETIANVKDKIKDKYEMEESTEKMTDIALEKGRCYVIIRPYDSIFTKALNKKSVEESTITESCFVKSDGDNTLDTKGIVKENFISISSDVERPSSDAKKTLESINEYVDVFNSNLTIFENNVTGSMIEEVTSIDEFLSESTSSSTKKSSTDKDDDFMKTVAPSFADGLSSGSDGGKMIKTLGLSEAYMEVMEPQYILPVKVNNTILGYYYIEAKDEINKLRKMSLNKNSNGMGINLNTMANMNQNQEHNPQEEFISTLSDVIVNRLDKKFLKKNESFKKEIYDILRFNDNYTREMRISFIEKEYIEEVEINNGAGMFKYTITLAKSYVALLMTYMMLKITRSRDQIMYYVRQGSVDSDISKSVNSAIRSIQRGSWDMKDILTGGVDKLYRVGNDGYNKHFIPVSKEGNKSIDMEILSGQDTSIRDELMEELLTLIRNSTGVPSVILNFANEADYAKTLVMANQRYARTIFGHQKSLNRSLTNIYRKLIKYENIQVDRDKEHSLDYNDFYIELPPPVSLLMTVIADNFAVQDASVRSALACVFGQSPDEKESRIQEKVYGDIMRSRMPSMGDLWEDIDNAKKRYEMEDLETNLTNPEDGDGVSRDIY